MYEYPVEPSPIFSTHTVSSLYSLDSLLYPIDAVAQGK